MTKLSILYSITLGLLLSLIIFGLLQGSLDISLKQLLSMLSAAAGWHLPWRYSQIQSLVFWQLRLPRILMVTFVGMSLGLSGAVLQRLLRNPLADPGLLGVASGAGFAVILAMVLGGLLLSPFIMPLIAFAGGLLIVVLLYLIAHYLQADRISAVLLGGIAINALLAAASSCLLYFADNGTLQRAIFWGFANIDSVSWPLVAATILTMICGAVLLLSQARALNVWSLGEAEADGLGLNVRQVLLCCMLGVALMVGAAVAVAGPIAFVGLIVPHITRLWCGVEARRLLPLSALLGGCLLLLADIVCHRINPPTILPLGIATALLGAPIFIALLIRYRNRL